MIAFCASWYVSRRCRNRLLHALCGNGAPKGQNKGKGGKSSSSSSTDKSETQLFLESVRDALPEAARMRSQTTLLASEWNVEVVYHQQMTSRGGVCVCPQKELPNVLASVGYTGHAAAVVLVQSPDELGLRAYPRDFIICTLLVPSLNGEIASVRAKRWLVQLGFGPRVEMIAEGTEISMPIHMLKMVCKLSPLRGWISGFHPAAIFMEQIVAHVPEAAVDSVICRENGTCTFLCHESVSSKLLKASGCNGAFFKVHRDDPSFVELDLFWLPESMSFDESLQLAKHDSARGLVEKGSSGRLAIRFESATACSEFARSQSLPDTSQLGRFKVTGIPIAAGLHGLAELLTARKWQLEQMVFMDDMHAIFLSKTRGLDDPLFWKAGNQPRQIRFKALNAVARGMARDAAAPSHSRVFPKLSARQQSKDDFVKSLIVDLDKEDESMRPDLKRPPVDPIGSTPAPKEAKANAGSPRTGEL